MEGNNGYFASGIWNNGTMTLTHTTVRQNAGSEDLDFAIHSSGPMTLTHSTVSENSAMSTAKEAATVINSTISGNDWLMNAGQLDGVTVTILNSTMSDSTIYVRSGVTVVLSNTVIEGACEIPGYSTGVVVSGGYNIESPGDTCGFDEPTDRVYVAATRLGLEPLADNGGWTETHALGEFSTAIDRIPEAECVDADGAPLTMDQRGFPRPRGDGCDVGAFEREDGTPVPARWTCPPQSYGAADGCHCGCGVIDPDCADGTVDSCDYCSAPGSCNGYSVCPGDIDGTQNWTCWS